MRLPLTGLALAAALAAAGGCPNNDIPDPVAPIAQCEGTGYTAFDPANHADQDVRVGAQGEIAALIEEAINDPAQATAKFTAAEDVYVTSAELSAKVEGRTDDHLSDRPNVGAGIHERISAGFTAGRAATTALDVELAAEQIDKGLIEFYFLSVYHELVQGQAAKWDEAFGYYGSGADNNLDNVRGLASTAKKRDANNGTSLEAQIFQGIVDGSCSLGTKLAAQEVETIDVLNDADIRPIIDEIDLAMQHVLAYSIGHEAFEIAEVKAELAAAPGDAALIGEARVKLVELEGFFAPIERLMRASGATAEADEWRALIDAGDASDATGAWIAGFDTDAIIAKIESHFAIDVIE